FYTGRARLDAASLNWGLGAARSDFGAWGFYSSNFPDERERTRSRLAWVRGYLPLGRWRLGSRLYWNGHRDRCRTRVGQDDFINDHDADVSGFDGHARLHHGHGTSAIGVNLQHANIESNALGGHRRDKVSLWVFRRQQLGKHWRLEAG